MPSSSFRLLLGSLATLATAPLFHGGAASASPHVYSNFVKGIDSLSACLDRASRTARKTGFTSDIQIVNLRSNTGAEFFADHASSSMAVNVHCIPKAGTASIGIAGMDNDQTFNKMREFYDAF